jgi:hypothetical protein
VVGAVTRVGYSAAKGAEVAVGAAAAEAELARCGGGGCGGVGDDVGEVSEKRGVKAEVR